EARLVRELTGRAVIADTVGSHVVDYSTHASGDIVEQFVPLHDAAVHRRRVETIGVVAGRGERSTFGARIAARIRMVRIASHGDRAPVVDGDDDAAGRRAQPAQRRLVLDHGPPSDAAQRNPCSYSSRYGHCSSTRG